MPTVLEELRVDRDMEKYKRSMFFIKEIKKNTVPEYYGCDSHHFDYYHAKHNIGPFTFHLEGKIETPHYGPHKKVAEQITWDSWTENNLSLTFIDNNAKPEPEPKEIKKVDKYDIINDTLNDYLR